jgi:protein-disulfide isomerase
MSLMPPVSNDDHTQGNPSAIIELVEYGDFQCSFCGGAYPIVKSIQEKFRDDIKFVFRHFPLAKIHPHAELAAIAAEAAGKQGKFWAMHDMLFANQNELHLSALRAYAGSIELDLLRFEKDIDDEKLWQKVENDFLSGMRSGVSGTPTFFVNGERYDGSWDEFHLSGYIRRKIEQLVSQQEKGS